MPDEWQHVAVSYQMGEWWNVYLDGEVLIEYPAEDQELVPTADDLLIGVEEPLGLSRFYSGDIDEFVLYDRGLTQEELQEVMGGGSALAGEPRGAALHAVGRRQGQLLAVT